MIFNKEQQILPITEKYLFYHYNRRILSYLIVMQYRFKHKTVNKQVDQVINTHIFQVTLAINFPN